MTVRCGDGIKGLLGSWAVCCLALSLVIVYLYATQLTTQGTSLHESTVQLSMPERQISLLERQSFIKSFQMELLNENIPFTTQTY